MAANAETRLTAPSEKANTSGTVTNGSAVATFAAVAGTRQYCQRALISAKGTIAAGVRATLQWTRGGVVQTMGFQIGVNFTTPGVFWLDFGNHPIEADDNTAITLTVPALGASGDGEATLSGFARLS